MSAFIVTGGSLLEIGCPSTLSRQTEQRVGFTTTLGGKRKAFIRRGGRRAWSVDVSIARPGEVSTLETVARSLGPYGWYPPEAVVGNLLSPQASGWEASPANAVDTGLAQLPDGTVASTLAGVSGPSSTVSVGNAHGAYEMVPLPTQGTITLGGWGRHGIRFTGWWRDADGAAISSWTTAAFEFEGWQWRQRVATPPTGARFFALSVSGGAQYARPTASWGSVARDELGTGCPHAVVHSPSHTPIALWEGANYTNSSYSVSEVG